ncbi:hypothetical protein ISF_03612 [Cordyceps fumosorosea ARSEF 2679]|uniref:Uncharacterized protein n=1 Tax=Cordyceps fumosorosea (strain ARSEF 2679) TaxID=1081104 RepID=A0A167ZF08_CORFA|nr:hypothetical protein ISF_03612 [Cordyceps fumosorosea ARSEF 2679]OAA67436.1 hypothetical protein ISF_03612 [Cordyceps fumosorosea ARSEF 2679]
MSGKRGKKAQRGNTDKRAQRPEESALADKVLPTIRTASAVRDDPNLGYKLRVLIYDLLNISKDPDSERRLNSTVDEYYISQPYFSFKESEVIKSAIIDAEPSLYHIPGNICCSGGDQLSSKSVEEAMRLLLSDFLDKRRASGDSRPCGPHHLAPLYAALYGIDMAELQVAKFLGRLRRNGV